MRYDLNLLYQEQAEKVRKAEAIIAELEAEIFEMKGACFGSWQALQNERVRLATEIERLTEALRRIASCENDVVAIARAALEKGK